MAVRFPADPEPGPPDPDPESPDPDPPLWLLVRVAEKGFEAHVSKRGC